MENMHNKAQVCNRDGHDRLEQFNWSCVGSASMDA